MKNAEQNEFNNLVGLHCLMLKGSDDFGEFIASIIIFWGGLCKNLTPEING
ncbi:hypothetical protein ACN081_03930 [Rothia sp. P13129]|uniref:hypothetical protein n=1 Tax=Rothia sp. P13129 TaxID=3402664 RepID=UPI003AD2A1F5